VKLARHLGAALLAVAVIVALGVAWAHSPAASWLGSGPGRPGIGAGASRPGIESGPGGPGGHVTFVPVGVPAGIRPLTADHEPVRLRPAAALNLSNLMDLARTVVIEAAFIALVVAIDVIRRRRRRARRSRTQPLPQ
jgi:hypothetical protein